MILGLQWASVMALLMGWFITGLHHALNVTVSHCNTASVDGLVYYRVTSCFE